MKMGKTEKKARNRCKFVNPKTFYKELYLKNKSAEEISEQYNVLFSEIYALLIGCISMFEDHKFEVIKTGILHLIDDLKLQIISHKNEI